MLKLCLVIQAMHNANLYIDFASAANNYRRLHGGGNAQPIARAVGLKSYGLPLHVIDATAGLGQDSFVLASLGCTVCMIERAPTIVDLLQDAIRRGLENMEIRNIINNMQLIAGDAINILRNLDANEYPDVVYLDPMFPEKSKSALVKQDLRILKQVVGADLDADLLLPIARSVAKRRVVVKRPRIAPYLQNTTPHASQHGKANRFDIYMPIRTSLQHS